MIYIRIRLISFKQIYCVKDISNIYINYFKKWLNDLSVQKKRTLRNLSFKNPFEKFPESGKLKLLNCPNIKL